MSPATITSPTLPGGSERPASSATLTSTPVRGYRTNRIIGGDAPSVYLARLEDGAPPDRPAIGRDRLDASLASHLSPPIFAGLDRDDLLSIGVPEDWLADVTAATEDSFFALAGHLPAEAAEALLEYAATGRLTPAAPPAPDPLGHPDTMRRFRVLDGADELAAALDAPFDKWSVFLHPAQRGVAERRFNGPARVAGSAGTGKTVVALHRVARILNADPDARVLLTTFSEPLARALERKLSILLGGRDHLAGRVTVASFRQIAEELFALATGRSPRLVDEALIRSLLGKAAEATGVTEFSPQFLLSEWRHVIDAWRIGSADAYADVPRMGRKNRLGARQRERLWTLVEFVQREIGRLGLVTPAMVFDTVRAAYDGRAAKPFSHVVVDEAQDLGVAELRFLAAIAPDGPDALFFAGDIGQRIFQQPFSWKGLGIDVRGRSSTLRVNYRTSHQIRLRADRLLPRLLRDVDGLEDERSGVVSVFDGIEPEIVVAADEATEAAGIAAFLTRLESEGTTPGEIGVFYRSDDQRARAREAVTAAGLPIRKQLDSGGEPDEGVLVAPMHLAKGLEFRAVAVVACDEGVLPLAGRVSDVADEFELDEVIATERQLLYVACTRARERLLLSAVAPGSEFLEDLDPRGDI